MSEDSAGEQMCQWFCETGVQPLQSCVGLCVTRVGERLCEVDVSEDSAGEKLGFLKFFSLIGIYFDHRFSQVLPFWPETSTKHHHL